MCVLGRERPAALGRTATRIRGTTWGVEEPHCGVRSELFLEIAGYEQIIDSGETRKTFFN